MLPKGWQTKKLRELIDAADAGVSVNGEDRPAGPGEFGVLKISSVTEGVFRPEQNKVIRADELHRASVHPQADRILVSRSNTEALVGASAYVICDQPQLFLPDKLWQLHSNSASTTHMQWLAHWLASDATRSSLSKLATGTSGSMKNIGKDQLLSLSVLVPPLAEQRHIANVLSTWDQTIANMERLLVNSQRQKQALNQHLLSDSPRKSRGRSPLNRELASSIFSPRSVRRNDGLELLSVMQDVGVVPRSSLDRKVVMPEGSTDGYKLVEPGNFVISLRSFEGGLEYSKFKGLVSPAYTVLKPSRPIVDDFYRHYFKSREFIGRLAVAVIGIRDGKQISYDDFAFLKLPYPSIQEQQLIATVLTAAEQTVQRHEADLQLMRNERAALMSQLLSGKRRVKPIEAEPEAQA
jgi:type I restriction enzyme S subunit